MSTALPEYLTAERLVERGFLPQDAEKVEAFARRLLAKDPHDEAVAVLESAPKTKGSPVCGHRFLSTCVREKGHEPPHRDASGNEWRGVESEDLR